MRIEGLKTPAMTGTTTNEQLAIARAVALAKRVSAWLMFDNPNPDGFERAHAQMLDEFANDPFGEPSNLAELLDEADARQEAICGAEGAVAEAHDRLRETWESIDAVLMRRKAKP